MDGRGGEIRTHGLFVPNEARYQLRYTPKMLANYQPRNKGRKDRAKLAQNQNLQRLFHHIITQKKSLPSFTPETFWA